MDKLLKPADVMQIVGCKRDKALSIMRQCDHIDLSDGRRANLRVREVDLLGWLDSKTVTPKEAEKAVKRPVKAIPRGSVKLIPYKKEA